MEIVAAFVGSAVWDNIFELSSFPKEDSDVRSTGYRCSPGGNATNSAVIFSQLTRKSSGAAGAFTPSDSRTTVCAMISDPLYDHDCQSLLRCLSSMGVDCSGCISLPPPALLARSAIMLAPASRTIVHHRSSLLREFACPHEILRSVGSGFARFPSAASASLFLLVHFEGRALRATAPALRQLRLHGLPGCPRPLLSVELEKTRAPEPFLEESTCCGSNFGTGRVVTHHPATLLPEASCSASVPPSVDASLPEDDGVLSMWDLAPFAHIVFVSKPLALDQSRKTSSARAKPVPASVGLGLKAAHGAESSARPDDHTKSREDGGAGSHADPASDSESPAAAIAAATIAVDAAWQRAVRRLPAGHLEAHGLETPQKQVIVMPWGELGAFVAVRDGGCWHHGVVPAHPPTGGIVVDTLGAGDTFNAAFLYAAGRCDAATGMDAHRSERVRSSLASILQSHSAEELPGSLLVSALRCAQAACFVAGEKVGKQGLCLPQSTIDYLKS